MCGIAGFIDLRSEDPQAIINKMIETIHHRGPDAADSWNDPASGVFLGFRRLAIQDLSPLGMQPMHSVSDRYVMVFNGEVYNFRKLRKELESDSVSFKSSSDSEVILAAIDAWGFEKALQSFQGMFAIALWDKHEKKLYLARDRMGEKPLYYGWHKGIFLFASELKPLFQHPKFRPKLNRDAIGLYVRNGNIPTPFSIFQGIYKLRQATYLCVDPKSKDISENTYWQLPLFQEGIYQGPHQIEELLKDTVRNQMIADVKLGCFLSGGIDSSLIAAIMQSVSSQPVNTYTIGFNDPKYNEAIHAKKVAKHLGTTHHELYINPDDMIDVVEKIPDLYDEPFADPSQIPTYVVSKMAKEDVTVILSGDGGDELFFGYTRYFLTMKRWQKFQKIWGRSIVGKSLNCIPLPLLKMAYNTASYAYRPLRYHSAAVVRSFANALSSNHSVDLYHEIFAQVKDPEDWVIGLSKEYDDYIANFIDSLKSKQTEDIISEYDIKNYLMDDILVKVDRASMGVSLETRVPLLDHRIVELSRHVPAIEKYNGSKGKLPLREILYQYVPQELIERPKQGFAIPIDQWLRGPLKHLGEEFLDQQRLEDQGIFNAARVNRLWTKHQSGYHDRGPFLWTFLMFQLWWQKYESYIER